MNDDMKVVRRLEHEKQKRQAIDDGLQGCLNCRFWEIVERPKKDGEGSIEGVPDEGYGQCRRFPPVLVRPLRDGEDAGLCTTHGPVFWVHPYTTGSDWCGEFREFGSENLGVNMHINALPLTIRTRNSLEGHGIRTLKDLLVMSESELMRVPNLGKQAVAEIRGVLHSHLSALLNSGS